MVEGCQAGGLGQLLHYMHEYNAESPKQGRKGLNSIVKTIYFSYLPIIYLWSELRKPGADRKRTGSATLDVRTVCLPYFIDGGQRIKGPRSLGFSTTRVSYPN